jgi:hypothetical protein
MNKNLKYLLGGVVIYYLAYKLFWDKSSNKDEGNILQKWKKNFDGKDLNAIVNTYSKDGILVSTFGDILNGREAIKGYFTDLFKKDNLSVTYIGEPTITKIDGSTMYTGIYRFSYTEKGKEMPVKARYSIIEKNDEIIKQHSSEVPN